MTAQVSHPSSVWAGLLPMQNTKSLLIGLVVQAIGTQWPVTTPWPLQDNVVSVALDVDPDWAFCGDIAAGWKLQAAHSTQDRALTSGFLQSRVRRSRPATVRYATIIEDMQGS